MIVVCPSCGTPFRHRANGVAAGAMAKCCRCSCLFPLSGRQGYRVEAVAEERRPDALRGPGFAEAADWRGADLAIGMDDPTIAGHLGRTALHGEPGAPRRAMTYWVVAGEPATGSGAAQTPAHRAPAEENSADHGEPALRFGLDTDRGDRHGSILRGAIVAGGMVGIGSAAFVLVRGSDAPWWLPAGAGIACALATGWGWTRWSARRR